MGTTVGGRFCECTLCGKEFMGSCGRALNFHMRIDHGLSESEAYSEAGLSLQNNVSFHEFNVKGAAF